jgi:hypothetical protein
MDQEILTQDEIKSRYPNEWILVVKPKLSRKLEVKSGVVACHNKKRDVVYRAMVKLKPKSSAVLYTGTVASDMAIIL